MRLWSRGLPAPFIEQSFPLANQNPYCRRKENWICPENQRAAPTLFQGKERSMRHHQTSSLLQRGLWIRQVKNHIILSNPETLGSQIYKDFKFQRVIKAAWFIYSWEALYTTCHLSSNHAFTYSIYFFRLANMSYLILRVVWYILNHPLKRDAESVWQTAELSSFPHGVWTVGDLNVPVLFTD